eukprot:GHRQ01035430.1.p1 GENE.GHRQ01035430.1~~GHRQ01035430.1.p1  ORF type:complete len:271 (+),score=138.04 GHRQ01035430.1:23-835(+)
MHALNRSSSQLSALYRLVKLWAQAHDLNDASRSTFNSTSLLYMTIFYLQQLQMLPALRELVPPALLRQPEQRLLQGHNKEQWADPWQLQLLLDVVQARAADWQQQYQQRQQPVPRLGCLLHGFFQQWSGPLSDWVLGKNRDLHADLWSGTWAPGTFPKPYTFSLQDPFHASDCPARAIGSNTNNNGGTAAFIAYMFSSSSRVMQQLLGGAAHHLQGLLLLVGSSRCLRVGWQVPLAGRCSGPVNRCFLVQHLESQTRIQLGQQKQQQQRQ